ncbi:MAG: type II secretion system F family protein [Chloroflexaceae bacterium]|nr:type II secretion system F family protein [Chloroflexaceae bacterium]
MELALVLIGSVVLFLVAGGMIVYALRSQRTAVIDDRLSRFTEASMSLEEIELQRPFHERVIVPVVQGVLDLLGKLSPQRGAEKVRQNLQLAGNPGGLTPAMFNGIRLALAVGLCLLSAVVTFSTMAQGQALMYTGVLTILGYLLPSMWLGQQISRRKKNMLKALPDALDLLTISVEAGLGFDVALQRVTDKWDDELSREFRRVLSDIRLGRSRREALRDMGERTQVEDIQTFVSAIIQADQLGVSMSKILSLQSDQMRIRRRQRAEEEAQKAPIKMLFPMVFLIFPALFVVILGPAVPRIMGGLGEAGDGPPPTPTPGPSGYLYEAAPVADAHIFAPAAPNVAAVEPLSPVPVSASYQPALTAASSTDAQEPFIMTDAASLSSR